LRSRRQVMLASQRDDPDAAFTFQIYGAANH
jgi:hypothetical protein